MSKIWFTSDTHWGHFNVIKYCNRPFTSVEEMDETLIENWNKAVGITDTVYHLGDVSLGLSPVELISPRLNGIKKLVPGNHDHCFPAHPKNKKRAKTEPEYFKKVYESVGWEVLPISLITEFPGLGRVWLNHFPYENQEAGYTLKYSQYRLVNDGLLLLHGHSHSSTPLKGNQIDVGVDAFNLTPVSLDAIVELVKANN